MLLSVKLTHSFFFSLAKKGQMKKPSCRKEEHSVQILLPVIGKAIHQTMLNFL
jgi:hypothetical protein